ncbi:hypothetical protein [Actinomadura atramentaria]|uniref:hypothetical protein n=1 Tax=Actinomadura atramentaria TaxID=1990 RepID=UPI0003A1CC9B|nr:hypothetical protein [Actinomadura atramentaria]
MRPTPITGAAPGKPTPITDTAPGGPAPIAGTAAGRPAPTRGPAPAPAAKPASAGAGDLLTRRLVALVHLQRELWLLGVGGRLTTAGGTESVTLTVLRPGLRPADRPVVLVAYESGAYRYLWCGGRVPVEQPGLAARELLGAR